MMTDQYQCTVIIPSYQSSRTIAACLTGVFAQDTTDSFEVIVVDSSSDETPALIRDQFPQVRLIHLPQQTFPGTARNLGVQQASADIICFLDSDCIPASNWLSSLLAWHRKGERIVGGAVINGTPESWVGWASYFSEFREFIPAGEAHHVDSLPTCNLSYRKAIFQEYGGFPDAYYPQEDLIFNWMLGKQGETILFDPAIQVNHIHRTQFRSFLAHQRRIGRVTTQVLRRTDLPGSALARRGIVALAALPLLVMLKFVRTLHVFVAWQPGIVLQHLLSWLLVAFGLLYWAVGFAQGLRSMSHPPDYERFTAPLDSGNKAMSSV